MLTLDVTCRWPMLFWHYASWNLRLASAPPPLPGPASPLWTSPLKELDLQAWKGTSLAHPALGVFMSVTIICRNQITVISQYEHFPLSFTLSIMSSDSTQAALEVGRCAQKGATLIHDMKFMFLWGTLSVTCWKFSWTHPCSQWHFHVFSPIEALNNNGETLHEAFAHYVVRDH